MPADPLRAPHDWLDQDAGPVVRPYAMTGGRVAPSGGEFDLVAFVVATVPELPPAAHLLAGATIVRELSRGFTG